MRYALRMTGRQHDELRSHLFPGDGNEAVALLLCGRREGEERHVLTTRKIVRVPYETCDRHPNRGTWPTNFVEPWKIVSFTGAFWGSKTPGTWPPWTCG